MQWVHYSQLVAHLSTSVDIINTAEAACNPKIPGIKNAGNYTLKIVPEYYQIFHNKNYQKQDFDQYLQKLISAFKYAQQKQNDNKEKRKNKSNAALHNAKHTSVMVSNINEKNIKKRNRKRNAKQANISPIEPPVPIKVKSPPGYKYLPQV